MFKLFIKASLVTLLTSSSITTEPLPPYIFAAFVNISLYFRNSSNISSELYPYAKRAAKIEEKSALYAWETKLMFNLGASLCESAGYKDFTFKMDVGPVWIINQGNDIKFKFGINGVMAPILHLTQGSKFDYKKSLKYGTMVFEKKQKKNGNLYGSNALAYSTANTFVTNHDGNHSGHELIHTYQYRRNCLYPIQIGDYWSEFTTKYFKEDKWVDDTGWFLNWSLQCGWASWRNKDKDYDIPLEQEAYYMERYRKKWEP